jgi:hypothetical protein
MLKQLHFFIIAKADLLNGTWCSFFVFILSAGIIQTLLSKSISLHLAPRASLVLEAVKIVNSRQEAAMPS